MKELNLNIDSCNVHCYEWGKENRQTIVSLHGLGNSGSTFFEMAEHLKDRYHILSFDNPGHGSTPPFENEDDYLFSNLSEWYDKVFQQVIEGPFYILGHSWGADIALHYSKQYPEKIKGLILLDGGYTFPDFQDDMTFTTTCEGWKQYMDNCSVYNNWGDIIREYKQYTNRWNENIEYMVSTLFRKSEKYEFVASMFTILSIIKAFFKESFTITYPYIKSPLILIHATLPHNLKNARKRGICQLKQNIKDVTVLSMNETGHMVHWEDPESIACEIQNWIEAVEQSV